MDRNEVMEIAEEVAVEGRLGDATRIVRMLDRMELILANFERLEGRIDSLKSRMDKMAQWAKTINERTNDATT